MRVEARKVFASKAAFPQRLEAASISRVFSARVKVVPFPFVPKIEFSAG
jgi:hypothetical protein